MIIITEKLAYHLCAGTRGKGFRHFGPAISLANDWPTDFKDKAKISLFGSVYSYATSVRLKFRVSSSFDSAYY